MEPAIELGRYQILGEIGRGSSGVVYHARDTLLGREVALKSFQTGDPARDAEEGTASNPHDDLLREARSAGRLSHPNVVTIYDVLEGDDDTLYIAMEYVPGRSLGEMLAETGPLDFERVVDLVSHIAAALDYLHAMGLVHRDVKPANILITHDGRVKLTDFGIAFRGREEAGEEGMVLGTPSYMAPEQILGTEITPRTDVWSLGVVLFEMVTGERPFDARSVAEIVHKVVHAPTPELPEGSGHPPSLGSLLGRALAKDPHWRFASAGELARELRRILYHAAGEVGEDLTDPRMLDRTVVARPAAIPASRGSSSAGRKATPRKAVLAVVLAVVVSAAALLAFGFASGWWREPAVVSADMATLDDRGMEAQRLLQHGQRLLALGDVEGAATFFEVVERLEPQLVGEQAERVHAQRLEAEAAASEASGKLAEVRSELGAREDRELLASARERVSREPDGEETLSALEGVGRSLAPAAAEAPAEAITAAASTQSRVTLEFWSEAPEGVLIVYADGEQLLRRGFSYFEPGRFLGRKPASGGFEEELTLPAGIQSLWVYLAQPGESARRVDVSGRLKAGESGTLRVRLPAEGGPTAELTSGG